ncbi:acyltransferase [Thiomicrorhabdus sp. Kp2]|uniref:acyltransferase n=1 Tax=Thiomicrorhabdus sp. Kp2 TaxID=1123518 RepID=UPI0003FA8AA5|nr:acyltransferase [Thiomicrorhabdus sp. Kp2]
MFKLIKYLNVFYHTFFIRRKYGSIGKNVRVWAPLYMTVNKVFLGNNVYIWPGSRIEVVSQFKGQFFDASITFEEGVSLQQRCHITSAGKLVIGKYTAILFDVMITNIDHEYHQIGVPVANQSLIIKETQIGENCFIGSGAKIQAGTILGKQCIVGTNAVVRGVYPDYCVIVGVPAKIVKRYNFNTAQWERTNAKGEFLSEL